MAQLLLRPLLVLFALLIAGHRGRSIPLAGDGRRAGCVPARADGSLIVRDGTARRLAR